MRTIPSSVSKDESEFWEVRKHFHLRIDPARKAAWEEGFTTESEYREPAEDRKAGDLLITVSNLLQIHARENPKATPKELYEIAKNDSRHSMAVRIESMLAAMVATDPKKNTREKAESFFIDTYIPATQAIVRTNKQLDAIGDHHFSQMQQNILQSDARVRTFVAADSNQPEAIKAEKQAALADNTPRPAMLVQQGQMATLDSQTLDAPILLGTDFLMDCIAVVMVGKDPKDPAHFITTLSHIDIGVDPQQAIRAIRDTIPDGFTTEATMLGSSVNESPYMNIRILEALHQEPRLSSIRYNTNAASTVLVNSHTGALFHHDLPESEGKHNGIADGEFPFPVATYPIAIEASPQRIEDARSALLYNELPSGNTQKLFSLPLTTGNALQAYAAHKEEVKEAKKQAEEDRAILQAFIKKYDLPNVPANAALTPEVVQQLQNALGIKVPFNAGEMGVHTWNAIGCVQNQDAILAGTDKNTQILCTSILGKFPSPILPRAATTPEGQTR